MAAVPRLDRLGASAAGGTNVAIRQSRPMRGGRPRPTQTTVHLARGWKCPRSHRSIWFRCRAPIRVAHPKRVSSQAGPEGSRRTGMRAMREREVRVAAAREAREMRVVFPRSYRLERAQSLAELWVSLAELWVKFEGTRGGLWNLEGPLQSIES